MDRRGPKRIVVDAVRVGEYGHSSWHAQLECGHSLSSQRKPKIGETRVCCKSCTVTSSLPVRLEEDGIPDFNNFMGDLKTRAVVASKVGVPIEQVDLRGGTATVFIDVLQLSRLLASS